MKISHRTKTIWLRVHKNLLGQELTRFVTMAHDASEEEEEGVRIASAQY
jgi:hypothetical protein